MEDDPTTTKTETASTGSCEPQQNQSQSQSQSQVQTLGEILVPSSAPSSPTPTGTLSRLGTRAAGQAGGSAGGQVSAITVVALLDKLVNMLESVQENQQRMEQRQQELEGAVKTVQGDVTRLSKVHLSTSNSVNKLLERSRKVSGGVKEVKERLDKQALQVKRLESNHAHLLKRNHFKVLIFQEDNEIPTDVFVKDSLKSPLPYDSESVLAPPSVLESVPGSVAASAAPSVAGDVRSPEENLHNVSLTSDDEEELTVHQQLMAEIDADSTTGLGTSRPFERRADRFKRNSLKKVDSLKKAFSRQSIEKKVNQITTKIVPQEKREKLIKSFSPNHPKSPTSKSSSFKVAPMTFNVKKVRDGDGPTPETSPSAASAHVEIPALGNLDSQIPLEVEGEVEAVAQVREALNEVSVGAEISVNGEVVEVNGDEHSQAEEKTAEVKAAVEAVAEAVGAGLAVPESVDDVGEDEEEEEEAPAEGATEAELPAANAIIPAANASIPTANASIPTASIAVEQAS